MLRTLHSGTAYLFSVAVTVFIFALLGGCHMSRRVRMTSQGSVRCQGTPAPNIYLQFLHFAFFVYNMPNNKNLSHFFKMCYGLRVILHISDATESTQRRYLISCSSHGFDIHLVGRLPHVKESSNEFSRIS